MLSCCWLFANLWTVACQTTLVIYRCLKNQKRFWLYILFDPLAAIPSSFVLLIFVLGISDRSHSCIVIKVHCEIISLLCFLFSLNLCNVNIHRLSSQHWRVMVAWFSEGKFGKERFVFELTFHSLLLWGAGYDPDPLQWALWFEGNARLALARCPLAMWHWANSFRPWSSLYLRLWIQKSNSWIHVLIVGDHGQFPCYDSDSSSIKKVRNDYPIAEYVIVNK